jgi:hypothetical protein
MLTLLALVGKMLTRPATDRTDATRKEAAETSGTMELASLRSSMTGGLLPIWSTSSLRKLRLRVQGKCCNSTSFNCKWKEKAAGALIYMITGCVPGHLAQLPRF